MAEIAESAAATDTVSATVTPALPLTDAQQRDLTNWIAEMVDKNILTLAQFLALK